METRRRMRVRPARSDEIEPIVEMSRRVQQALTMAGSLQEFGPLATTLVAAHIAAGNAYVLDGGSRLLGSVFVGPAFPAAREALAQWGLDDRERPLWFLEKLMIEPAEQGRGLGDTLLAGVQTRVRSQSPTPAPAIVLDCWAGNMPLRAV